YPFRIGPPSHGSGSGRFATPYETRTYGGVGGAEERSFPLSRSTTEKRLLIGAKLRLFSPAKRPPERRLQPRLAAPHSGKPQTVSISRIPRRRITLSVSEGTVLPEPRPLADAQGYSAYALRNRRGAQRR